jgi:hypothetical protein
MVQDMAVTAPTQSTTTPATALGTGDVLISKVTQLDQANNSYANWEYQFNFNGNAGIAAGTITAQIDLLNGVAWSNQPTTTNANINPSEVIPSGQTSAKYYGFVKSGTGPYYLAFGTFTKVKDLTNYRVYNLQFIATQQPTN